MWGVYVGCATVCRVYGVWGYVCLWWVYVVVCVYACVPCSVAVVRATEWVCMCWCVACMPVLYVVLRTKMCNIYPYSWGVHVCTLQYGTL